MTDEIDELREQTRGTDRISAEVGDGDGSEETEDSDETSGEDAESETSEETTGKENRGPSPSDSFGDVFDERAGRTEGGIDPRSFSAEDPRLSALLLALQDTGEIEDVGGALCEAVGAREPPKYDRDTVVRLALTYALRETAPEYFEELAQEA